MHDPLTVAFTIRIPLPWKIDSFVKSEGRVWAKYDLAIVWHKDPEKDGSDDSCGWFMRSRHGSKLVLEKIVKRFEYDWDRVFKPGREDHDPDDGEFVERVYHCGYFKPGGHPNLSVSGIVLNLFFLAACEHFQSDGLSNWRKAKRFMRKHLLDILLFAENTSDSLHDTITLKFGNDTKREERIRNMASCIYGWILRAEQPWYRHPRWHIHHWRLQVPLFQQLWRWLFVRCSKCGRGFRWKESVFGSWSGTEIWHECCEENVACKQESTSSNN